MSDYLTAEVIEKAATALADDWNPECDPVLAAMFRDYAQTALTAVLPDIIRKAQAEAWDEGAQAAWERSTPEVNGQNYYWRSDGEPVNPCRTAGMNHRNNTEGETND